LRRSQARAAALEVASFVAIVETKSVFHRSLLHSATRSAVLDGVARKLAPLRLRSPRSSRSLKRKRVSPIAPALGDAQCRSNGGRFALVQWPES